MPTRFFLDTEFLESGPAYPLHLISLGLVCENGAEYYAESSEFPSNLAGPWVREHVFPHLTWKEANPNRTIAVEVLRFVTGCCEMPSKPEFWGYFSDYDWVLFCQLFGSMIMLPTGWPMLCYDLRQWLDHKELYNVRQPDNDRHHALNDARWIAETYKKYEG